MSEFDNIVLRRCLGHGAFGIVFKAKNQEKRCAVKFILVEDEEPDKNTKRECEIALELSHQNIIRTDHVDTLKLSSPKLQELFKTDLLKAESQHSLVDQFVGKARRSGSVKFVRICMEMGGKTLREWLSKIQSPSDKIVQKNQIEIIQGICLGLNYLHSRNILHRDLKPENIMFSYSERFFLFPVKIGDFGLSRFVPTSTSTKLSSRVGTEDYMAPETYSSNYGCEGDLYAMGIIIWEVVQFIHHSKRRRMVDELVNDQKTELVDVGGLEPEIKNTIIELTKRNASDRRQGFQRLLALVERQSVKTDERKQKESGMPWWVRLIYGEFHDVQAASPRVWGQNRTFESLPECECQSTVPIKEDGEEEEMLWALEGDQLPYKWPVFTYSEAYFQKIVTNLVNLQEKTNQNNYMELEVLKILSLLEPGHIELTFLLVLLKICLTNHDNLALINRFDEPFSKQTNGNESYGLIRDCLGRLSVKSLVVNFQHDGSTVLIMEQVQDAVRETIPCESTMCSLMEGLLVVIPTLSLVNLKHVRTIWEHAFEAGFIKYRYHLAIIFKRMMALKVFPELIPFAERSIRLLSKSLDDEDDEVHNLQYYLAVALIKNDKFLSALQNFLILHEKMKKLHGAEDDRTCKIARKIGIVLYKLQRFEESLKWIESVLKIQEKVCGMGHKDTMKTMKNKADVLKALGRDQDSNNLYHIVLEFREANFGALHPATLSIRHDIAILLFDQGRYDDAKPALEALLQQRTDVLGFDHSDTLQTEFYLAETLWALAESFQEKDLAYGRMKNVLKLQTNSLGRSHSDTKRTSERLMDSGWLW